MFQRTLLFPDVEPVRGAKLSKQAARHEQGCQTNKACAKGDAIPARHELKGDATAARHEQKGMPG